MALIKVMKVPHTKQKKSIHQIIIQMDGDSSVDFHWFLSNLSRSEPSPSNNKENAA
jgi:hypothetical protein